MNRATLSLLFVGLLACFGALVTAQNVAAAKQPDANANSTTRKPVRQTELSTAAIDQSKETEYKAAKAKAQTEYKQAAAKCRKRSSKAIPGCMADAKAVRTQALEEAKTRWGKEQ